MRDSDARSAGRAVADWHRRLHPDADGAGGDRAALARLRRAETPGAVLLEPETIRLYGKVREALGRDRLSEAQTAALAVAAGTLASVRPGAGPAPTFATALGQLPNGQVATTGQRQIMSPLRFGNLMRAREPEELMRHMRRALALLGPRLFSIPRFAADIFVWDDEVRRSWIFQYHQEGAAAPE